QLLVSYTQAIVTPDIRPKDISTLPDFGPPAQLAPKILSPGLKPAVLNQPYSFQLAATGGERPFKWEIVGATPAGFALSPEGLLTGHAAKAGTITLRLKVSGIDRQTSQATFKLEVLENDPHGGAAVGVPAGGPPAPTPNPADKPKPDQLKDDG
ncbi:MAG TPA: putative Ig domain-containing protein, partial [Planctomycetota bacterium]|nr:putative Ig domain-containing protein [Planctomycetota bacterium]